MIIGTAGHIDHGKTALVRALTGVECDRLAEEKARGITIDLGFAYQPMEDGTILAFIDVPGHERFVHTMLAGATGIDYAMLTVAANEGVKPQTLEHLAILQLLEIERGVIVITKSDLATPDELSSLSENLRSLLAGTPLGAADIMPVSAMTGDGIDALSAHLKSAAAARSARTGDGRFRLSVDRVFTLAGVGVVVTGTVLSGSVRVGDMVQVSPTGVEARVRSIHAQNQSADMGRSGDRCALNLVGPKISKQAISRGDVVLDPALHMPTDRIDARLRILQTEDKPVGQWFPVRLHSAASDVGAHVVLLADKSIEPGETADVQLVLDRPISATVPDRFVIRDSGAQRTIGGGRFLDLRPPARKRRSPERQMLRAALSVDDPLAAFGALLNLPPFAFDVSAFARDWALSDAQFADIVSKLKLKILSAGPEKIAFSEEQWDIYSSAVQAAVSGYHATNPDLQGIGREQLRLMLQPRLNKSAFAAALQDMAQKGDIVFEGAFVRLASHHVRLTAADSEAWDLITPLLDGDSRFRPPRVRDIASTLKLPERKVRTLLKAAARLGWVDEIAHDHFFLRPVVDEMTRVATDVAANSASREFTAAEFRDRLDNGRKVAIQILEFFDRHGVTLNHGDVRRINTHRIDLFGAPGSTPVASVGGVSSPVGRSDFKSEWGSEPVLGGFDSHPPPPIVRAKHG